MSALLMAAVVRLRNCTHCLFCSPTISPADLSITLSALYIAFPVCPIRHRH